MSTLMPSTKPMGRSSSTHERRSLAPARALVSSRIHNFATEHISKPSYHEPEHMTPTEPHRPAAHVAPAHRGRDRGAFSSDDNALTKQVVATHAPDMEDLDVRPILAVIEHIMRLSGPFATPGEYITSHGARAHTPVDKALHTSHRPLDEHKAYHASHLSAFDPDAEIFKILAYSINNISSEIICKCSDGGETHSVTMDLLKSLSNYSWDAKAVIVFAAFAINYGELWLVEQLQTTSQLAKNIAALKDLPTIMDHADDLKKRFDAVLDLLNQVLKVIHCIIEFKELPKLNTGHESPEINAAMAHIPTAVYWIVRSLLVCASTLMSLIGSGHDYMSSTSESWEILNLAHKLSVILEHLQNQLNKSKDIIHLEKSEYANIVFKIILDSYHIDNTTVLKSMIKHREDQRPLFDGSTKQKEQIDVLKHKYVLLLISDLDLPQEELHILHLIYSQHPMRHEYEVLWLPILDPNVPMTPMQETVFYNLRNSMPWYSVDHPSLVEPVAIRTIRDMWKFVHKPILVVLDPQGKPANHDALPMMWIWGPSAYPFTRARESALWLDSKWNIYLLVDEIDTRFSDWIRDNKVICLYGGEDIEWIRRFTGSARAAAAALRVPLEMFYVGKRYPKEKVRRCHEEIGRDRLSHIFADDYNDYVWYFWVRLWSMWNSKKQTGSTVDNDRIMREIMDILAYDSSDHGWAVFSRANFEITKANGEKVTPVLESYNDWGYKVDHPDKFVKVLDEQLRGHELKQHCNRLILPGQAGYIPEPIICSECGQVMENFIMYRCCTD